MDLIEKAAQRLEQLKRAGVDTSAPPAALKPTPEKSRATKHVEETFQGAQVKIDLARLESMGIITPQNARSAVAEEYRVIKRPLLRNAAGKGVANIEHPNLIMVTSSVPNEGKSFTAINLAISMAMELERTVLLIDADVARPSVLSRLGLPPSRGLMDILFEKSTLSEAMLQTNIEKFSILPAGTPDKRSTEMLASQAMMDLLRSIATHHANRIVIFDSPPLLATTEARVLATHMGQIVMVVEAEKTIQGVVKEALATIENCPVKYMVLNKISKSSEVNYYGDYANSDDGKTKK